MPNLTGNPNPDPRPSWTRRLLALALVCAVLGAGAWLAGRDGGSLGPSGHSSAGASGKRTSSSGVHWRSPKEGPAAVADGGAAGEVRGTVVDAFSGAPIANAEISLRSESGEIADDTVSEGDGGFSFAKVSGVTVAAQSPGYAFHAQPLPHGAAATHLRLQLEAGVTVRGRVLDAHGDGVPGAEVWVEDVEGAGERWPTPVSSNAVADREGRFSISDAPSGKLVCHARHPLHAAGSVELGHLGPGRSREGVEIILADGGSIAGRVTGPDGSPLAGAKVGFIAERDDDNERPGRGEPAEVRGESGADGRYQIDHLQAGNGWIAAVTTEGDAGARVTVVEGGTAHADLRLLNGTVVEGRVVDQDGAPIANARLHAWMGGGVGGGEMMAAISLHREVRQQNPVTSGADGHFVISGLHGEGPFGFEATSPGGERGAGTAMGGVKDAVVTIVRGATLAGTVLTAAGLPADVRGTARAEAEFADNDVLVGPVESGTFEIRGVVAGSYSTTVEVAGGGEAAPVVVTVPEHATGSIPVTIRLPTRSAVHGRLVDGQGNPVPGARISVSSQRSMDDFAVAGNDSGRLDWEAAVNSGPDGRFTLEIAAGETKLFIYHPEFQPALVGVTVGTDSDTDAGTIALHAGEGASAVFEFSGIGAVIGADQNGVYFVRGFTPNGPAERAGLKVKDQIAAVDGVVTEGMAMGDLIMRIRGPVGTTVSLTVIRAGTPQSFVVDVVREKIRA